MPVLFILFVVFAAMELAVMIEVGSQIGTIATLFLILFTAVAGLSIMVRQGMGVMARLQQAAVEGRSPAVEIIEAFLLAIAGVMLFVPGFVTDFAGFLLLTPFRGYMARSAIGSWVARHTPSGASWQTYSNHSSSQGQSKEQGQIIEDVEYENLDSKK